MLDPASEINGSSWGPVSLWYIPCVLFLLSAPSDHEGADLTKSIYGLRDEYLGLRQDQTIAQERIEGLCHHDLSDGSADSYSRQAAEHDVLGWRSLPKVIQNYRHSRYEDVSTLEMLVQRRDGFLRLMQKAMREKLGTDADEVANVLSKQGINRQFAKQALELARQQGGFTIFAIVDALTRISQECANAGDRLDADQQAASLFDLVSPASTQAENAARSTELAVAT